MSMDVSRLAIEVTTTGIKEASAALGGLSRSAAGADKRVTSLTANLAKMMTQSTSTAASANALNGVMGQIANALAQTSANAAATARALAQATQGISGLTTASNQASNALYRKSGAAGTAVTTLKAMATAASAYLGLNFARSIVQQADAWQLMQARLTVATGSLHNAQVAQEEIFQISQRLRTPLEANLQLYTRLAPAMQRMGKSHEDTSKVVEGVGLAMKLSGTTAGEAASAMLQLSQSFNAGRLNGAEFNSIAEAAPKLLEAMAAKMGVTRGELKKLGSDGKITGQVMAEAIAEAAPKWEAQFKNLPITVGDALTQFTNAWKKAMGELGEDTEFNKKLAGAVQSAQSLIPAIRDEMAGAFIAVMQWIEKNKESLAGLWGQVKGLISDVWEIVGGMFGLARGTDEAVGGVELLASGILGVRLVLAAAVDLVKLIGASFVHVGLDIAQIFVAPLQGSLFIIQKIAEGVSYTFSLLSKGAAAAGLDGTAEALASAASGVDKFVAAQADYNAQIFGMIDAGRKLADGWLEGWRTGKTEVSKVLEVEEQRLAVAKKKGEIDKKAWNADMNPKQPVDEKAQKAHEKAVKDANSELSKQLDMYRELALSLDQLQKHGLEGAKLTAAQKEELDLREKLRVATDSQAKKVLEQAIATNLANQEIERLVKSQREMLEAQEKYKKEVEARIEAETKEAVALERKVETYGKAKGEIEALALAEERLNLIGMISSGATEEQIAQQNRLIDAMVRRQEAAEKLGGLETLDKLEKMLDPSKAEKFGNVLADCFGKAGKGLQGLIKALESYEKRESRVEKLRQQAEKYKSNDLKKYGQLTEAINREEVEGRLRGYGDMAGAAKEFFSEGSKGYKVLEAAERTFRMFEMAMALQSFVEKSGFLTMFTAQKLASDTTVAASSTASAAVQTAAATTVATASATAAVANQGLGDPYTAFPRIAAMIAIMAGLGLMIGGGSKSVPAFDLKQHQAKQHTGTVLGDETAKSESIARSLERMRENSNIGLTYTSEMLISLRNIDNKIGNLAGSVAKVNGLRTGANFGIKTGSNTSGGIFGLFSKTTTREILDTGLKLTGSLASMALQQYVDIQETKTRNGFLGIGASTKTSQWREFQNVNGGLAHEIGGIFSDITDTIKTAGAALGFNTDYITNSLRNFLLDTEVSLKGLQGADLESALNSMFSAIADDMALVALPQFTEFQRMGEGYFETLTRLATGVERARNALEGLNIDMVSLIEVGNKTGEVDAELVRSSIIRKEAGTSLAKIFEILDGSMAELVEGYKELTRLRNAMQTAGLGGNLSLDLIRGVGGLSELSESFDNFFNDFYTDQERANLSMSHLNMEFGRLGIAVPQSKEAFRSLVQTLMQGTAWQQELAGRVLALSDEWIDAMDQTEQAREDLLGSARDVLAEAYEREANALQDTIDKMRDFADSMKDFRDSLIMGDLSTKSDMEKYQTALARYNEVSAKALTGDEAAMEQYEKVASELLQYSRLVNASGSAYTADFERVLAESAALEQYAETQVDVATASLEQLKAQVEALIDIDESVKTVAQAIAELHAIMAAQGTPIPVPNVDGSHANGLSHVPYNGYIAELHEGERVLTAAENKSLPAMLAGSQSNAELVAEIKALREEVRVLREAQATNTGALIDATYDANAAAAQTVVEGTKEAAQDAAYAQRTNIGLN